MMKPNGNRVKYVYVYKQSDMHRALNFCPDHNYPKLRSREGLTVLIYILCSVASHREEDNDLVVLKAGIDITSASTDPCCCTKYYVTTVLEFQVYCEKYKFICRNTGFIVMNSSYTACCCTAIP